MCDNVAAAAQSQAGATAAGFAPLTPSVAPYLGLLLVAVAIQEAAQLLLWRFHL